MEKLAEKYGPVATIWLGTTPTVYITDIDIAREAFRKNDFAGRADIPIFSMSFPSKQASNLIQNLISGEFLIGDIIFSDYGHYWEALRRVTHSAVQYVFPLNATQIVKTFI